MEGKKYSRPLELKDVHITDEFWGREQELVRTEVIPYQWEALNDRVPGAAPSYCMRNFRVAGKMMREKRERGAEFIAPAYTYRGFEALPEDPANPDPDKFYGFVFQDSDFAKWIEAAGYSLLNHPDAELERTADEAIDIVCAAQAENGYLDTYYIINGMDRIFTNLRDHHELYCFGHLAEGAVAYYQATGKNKLLLAAKRYADFICEKFGAEEGKCKGYPGHEIAEMALTRLFELTGEQKYLDLSRFFLDMRGTRPYYFDEEEKERAGHEGRPYKEPAEGLRFQYHQAHVPVREQSEAVGHAVRAVYLYSGMADVARLTGDEAMLAACERLWNSIVNEKLYITGGIGGTHLGEAFSHPYDLPNDTAYSETCAAIGLVFFARRMLQIQADSRYGDVMEQALYNTVLAGMALDGKSFFYVNPLEAVPEDCVRDERKRHVKSVRQKWFGCACCPPNIARIVSSVGAYVYTAGADTLYTHLYVGSRAEFELGGKRLDMRLESGFPWEGAVKAALHVEEENGGVQGTLAFRIPGWCREMTAEVRGIAGGGRTVCDCSVKRGGSGDIAEVSTFAVFLDTKAIQELLAMAGSTKPESGEETGGSVGACAAERQSGENRKMSVRVEKGYLYLTGEWRDGDEIYLNIPMEVRCVTANTKVREDAGKVAFLRGPLCYCMEEADNGKNLHLLRADPAKAMTAAHAEQGGTVMSGVSVETSRELGHEMRILKVPGLRQQSSGDKDALYAAYAPAKEQEVTLTFVPYYAWNNRGEGEMSVWVRS